MRLIAHRGASAYAPENTLAALRLALDLGASEVEFDVHQTADGRLAVLHDPHLKRVARARKRVRDLALGELQRFDVGGWFAPRFIGERIPSLEEVLGLLRGRAAPHVEIKSPVKKNPRVAEILLRTLRSHDPEGRSVVSSFDVPTLMALRRLDARLKLGLLISVPIGGRSLRLAGDLGAVSLEVSRRGVSARLVQAAHSRGLGVLVYTVDEAATADRLESIGVDGIFTNRPDLRAASLAVGGTK